MPTSPRAVDVPFKALLDALGDAFTLYDHGWRFVYVNPAAANLVGRQAEDLLGKVVWEEFPEARETGVYRTYLRAVEEQKPAVWEDFYAPLQRWLEVRAVPTSEGLAVHARDVTDRKRAEAVQASAARNTAVRADISQALAAGRDVQSMLQACAQALVDRAQAAFARIWTLNHPTQILELQASAGQYTHLDGPHGRVPVGKFKIGLIAEEGAPHLSNDVLHDPRVGDKEWARREGMVAFAGYPLKVNGRVTGVMALFSKQPLDEQLLEALASISDAVAQGTERLRTEQELEKRAEELVRSNRELEQFAYVASHDLQEPLRMVASYTQLLGRRYKGKLDADADEFIAFAVSGVARMQALINDLLAFSRVGTRGKNFAAVSVATVVERALANLTTAIAESGAQVQVSPLPEVRGDLSQLTQLFQNLIGNALKFRAEGRGPVITVDAVAEGAQVVFSVKDNGIGIEPQYFERIFVIFQRLHARDVYAGTGIGLAICKKIVERHGGKIWLESAPGEGTTFKLTLPAA